MLTRIVGTTGRIVGGLVVGMAFGSHSPHKIWFIISGLMLAVACTVAEWKLSR